MGSHRLVSRPVPLGSQDSHGSLEMGRNLQVSKFNVLPFHIRTPECAAQGLGQSPDSDLGLQGSGPQGWGSQERAPCLSPVFWETSSSVLQWDSWKDQSLLRGS